MAVNKKKVNMAVYVAHAMPNTLDYDPYIVGVFTSYEAAEEAIEIEKTATKSAESFTFDVTRTEINRIDAHKLMYASSTEGIE